MSRIDHEFGVMIDTCKKEHAELLSLRDEVIALRAQVERQRWISVKERLPKLNLEVWGYCLSTGYRSAMTRRKAGNGSDRWWAPHGRLIGNVTHWMLLPEPPKEDTE